MEKNGNFLPLSFLPSNQSTFIKNHTDLGIVCACANDKHGITDRE